MRSLLISLALLCPTISSAHHDPSKVIEHLSKKIKQGTNLTQSHFERAIELHSIGKDTLALKDLAIVIKRQPNHTRSYVISGDIQAKLKHYKSAKQYYQKALDTTANKSPILMALAEISLSQKQHETTYSQCQQAITLSTKPKVDWYLTRARAQLHLNDLKARANMLKSACRQNSSIVLKHAWIDAEIDAKQPKSVAGLVDRELKSSRFISAWLIRSARIHKLQGLPYKQKLEQAIKEINQRLHPKRPDLSILAERCHARFLLDLKKDALKDLQQLKKYPSCAADVDYLQHIFLKGSSK